MHRKPRPGPLAHALLLVFLVSGLAGCIGTEALDADVPDADSLLPAEDDDDQSSGGGSEPEPQPQSGAQPQPEPEPEPQAEPQPEPEPEPRPEPEPQPDPEPLPPSWTLTLHDARAAEWDAPRVEARVTWTHSFLAGATVRVDWTAPDGTTVTDQLAPDPDAQSAHVVRDFAAGLGAHQVSASANWTGVDGSSELRHDDMSVTVWQSLRVIAYASEQHASDQNPFREDRLVPFAPWDNDSAFDLLDRMADRFDFAVDAYYREDLESWFVDAINDTAFQWEEPQILGYSLNWMLLVNGEKSQTAADDTFPELGDVVEYRYVRCSSTGQCDGL